MSRDRPKTLDDLRSAVIDAVLYWRELDQMRDDGDLDDETYAAFTQERLDDLAKAADKYDKAEKYAARVSGASAAR